MEGGSKHPDIPLNSLYGLEKLKPYKGYKDMEGAPNTLIFP